MTSAYFIGSMVVIIVLALHRLRVILRQSRSDQDDVSVLDIDASGEVDALTDGLLILRSLFGLLRRCTKQWCCVYLNCVDCDSDDY
jgi:hypothetical protein